MRRVRRYEKKLGGLEGVEVEGGERKEVSLELVGGELEVVKKENEWVVERGMLEIMIEV